MSVLFAASTSNKEAFVHTIQDLKAGYKKFRSGAYAEQTDQYRELATGQDPDVMVISCADSRVEPAEIFAATPGQLFVVRNVANLVHARDADQTAHSVASAVEFAVTALKVKHIVVLGHAACGGVKACLSAGNGQPVGEFIAPWVEALDATRDQVLASSPADPQTALEHAGVGTSLDNLMSYAFVRDAVAAGTLELHGAWFNIGPGELSWRDPKTGEFSLFDA